MRVALGVAIVSLFLAACSSSGQSPVPTAPSPPLSQGPPPRVSITEISVPAEPLYVAAGNAAVYFGFGSSGNGSPLYRYANGAFVQTMQAPPPSGYDGGGGVYGINVARSGAVYWLSSYFYGQQFMPAIMVQCGGGGGTATLCEPNVEEPTTMVTDAHGVFWVGGITDSGGGQIATSSGQTFSSNTEGVLQLIDGPGDAVWGLLETTMPQQDSLVRFALSGQTIVIAQDIALPPGTLAGDMTVGGDGNMWLTDYAHSQVARVTPQGAITEYASPHGIDAPSYGEVQIATACDGAVWYTESNYGAVVRMSDTGSATEYAMPSSNGYPAPISAASGGAICTRTMWVGEVRASKLASITY
jgi:hypothetical protein